jgi:small-conductance mechanosensitive channel/CRP-like cAMP-binding protein
MKAAPRPPLWVRRVLGPVVILVVVAAVVFGARALGISSLRFSGRDYGAFALGLAFLLVFVRLANYVAFDVLFRMRRGSEAPALLRELVALLLFLLGATLLFKTILSVQLTAVLATSAVITAVIGLALQDTLGNLFAGLALHLEKSFQVGDMVRLGETVGFIEEMSWRAMKIRTLLDSRFVVPNGVAAREKLEVFPAGRGPYGRACRISLEYRVSPQRVMELLQRTVVAVRGVVPHPAPVVYLNHFGEYAMQYEIRYWIEDYFRFLQVDSDVRERIWYALGREGIDIPLPVSVRYQYTRPWQEPEPQTAAAADRLDGVEILSPLTAEERDKLRRRLKHVVFARGENVFVEGSQAHSLYVVETGELAVHVVDKQGREVEVGRLAPGDAFGEMALLTGEPRSATVQAKTEAALYRIDKDAFADVLTENPRLLHDISRLMEARREKNQDAIDRARDTSKTGPVPAGSLLSRISRFFGFSEPP